MSIQKHKVGKLLFTAAFVLFFHLNSLAQSGSPQRQLAAEGDTVWVIVNHVKPDKRAQFERFTHEIFWPAAQRLSTEEQRLFRQTRVLNATAPEKDGTYTYVFLMDPVISGGDYDIRSILNKMYSKAEAEKYWNLFYEILTRDGDMYKVVQSRH